MLDDGNGRGVELGHQLKGGVGVVEIVVAQGLALKLPGGGDAGAGLSGAVKGGLLVGVLTVAQHLRPLPGQGNFLAKGIVFLSRHPAGNGRVISGGVGVGLGRQLPAQGKAAGALLVFQLRDQGAVVARVGDDGDERVILGGRPHHGRPMSIFSMQRSRSAPAARVSRKG